MCTEERLEEIGKLAKDLLNPSKHHHPSAKSCPTCRTGAALDDLLAVAEAARELAERWEGPDMLDRRVEDWDARNRLREALKQLGGDDE